MTQAINDMCPWSGDPVSEKALTQYRGHTVGFCNTGCRDKFEKAIHAFDAHLADMTQIAEAKHSGSTTPTIAPTGALKTR